jgi:hypothetical protein
MLDRLNEVNEPLTIQSADSAAMERYGRVLKGIDCSEMFDAAMRAANPEGPTYLRDLDELKRFDSFRQIGSQVYGEDSMLQAGLCFGMNDRMNGMEYHEGSEVIVAVTDAVLILGRTEDIVNQNWDSSLAELFFIPAGTALELYGHTLHLAPCRVSDEAFVTIIILPEGTNRPLESRTPDDPTYFMENKWMLCHPESPAVQRGAHVGITGENIRVRPVRG